MSCKSKFGTKKVRLNEIESSPCKEETQSHLKIISRSNKRDIATCYKEKHARNRTNTISFE